MQVELFLDPSNVRAVFASIATDPVANTVKGHAYAPLPSAVTEWRDRIWSEIKTAIDDVSEKGRDAIGGWISQVKDIVSDMQAAVGERARDVIAQVQTMLFEACQALQSVMLRLLPATVTVFGQTANLNELGVQYQLSVGTTLVASLNWALQLAGGATLAVSARYTLLPA